ncbi:MAG TPA: serine hydrolase [Bacteriovoracaceae bacterium]|nr:serine hydrolase [Bacteriovoracaceae bacterium]
MKKSDIPYYDDFLSPALKASLLNSASPVKGVDHLQEVGTGGGLENKDSLTFLCALYESVKDELNLVLTGRIRDRKFIDERTKALSTFNADLKRDYLSPDYKTVMGLEDGDGRIVIGPKSDKYSNPGGEAIAPIPEYLQGNHVTLFGPPDSAKLSINAMNAFHRKLKDEPSVVQELLDAHPSLPKWGADDEDSKTPMRQDLISAGVNLTKCFDGTLAVDKYKLEKENLSLPIKRFPGLALPSFFFLYKENPLPLHLYDFALHFFENWHNKKALAFYVPKLENEEEARYIRIMLETAEKMLKKIHPEYEVGTIRLMIVLENPRAVFRTHEIMDELYPYFVGASLGWHDYLASTARLFKEDANYRIPVKADPNIVIKYIKASHDLLAEVVGSRGGIKVGGMYGILPVSQDLMSPSYQVTIKGYIRDVITQFKRDLTGFWVAHPDFVRLGLAMVSAWKIHLTGNSVPLETLVKNLLKDEHHKEILGFIHGPDIKGLDKSDPMYGRSLIVADMKESNFIANNHPDEIRYNVFQSLQYITDWLSGNGCVALPAQIGGIPVRVMDDLATAERSRWEVWHEIHYGRFALSDFLRIAHEEYHFIRKNLSDEKKIVQVKWNETTAKWYPLALNLMIKLMTDEEPVEFATQLLLPFTIDKVREANDPWQAAMAIDPDKFKLSDYVKRFNYYFEMCGNLTFARTMAQSLTTDFKQAEALISNFKKADILEAAAFHGDIGEGKATLDKLAASEQSEVSENEIELRENGQKYKQKFGMKFLVSAQGKTGTEMLAILKERFGNSESQEIINAVEALWQITNKRMTAHPLNSLYSELQKAFIKHEIKDAQISIMTGQGIQNISFGKASNQTWFEMASLSKTVGSAFAIEYFNRKGIELSTSVNELLAKTASSFRLMDGDDVTIAHLMSHSALNLHYVNGVPANRPMPKITEFLNGNTEYGYEPVKVINPPGKMFQYSGGGFLVLEHLLEALEKKTIFELTRPFLDSLGMQGFSFEQEDIQGVNYAQGFKDSGELVEGSRKMFPAIAAGAMGTSEAMATFLRQLEKAFHSTTGSGPLSHDTACLMLHGTDKGCMKFMGVKMGLGVFIGEAGLNKFAIHQGANDGFRCIYLHCFAGPDRGKGLVALANADLKGVLFNAEVTQLILKNFHMEGIDISQFKSEFTWASIPQQDVVNTGYKNLVFNAFIPTRPEPIIDKGPKDPFASYNLAVDGKILEVSNERFARAENLLSDHLPKFDPELFGKQGKVMDSWETVRHNLSGVDTLVFSLKKPSPVQYIFLSTKYHFGNHSPFVRLEGLQDDKWVELLPKTGIEGHSEIRIKLEKPSETITKVRVSMYPDGGFTRLGLYQNLPEEEKKQFNGKCVPCEEKIPHTVKPLSIKYIPTTEEIKTNMSVLKTGDSFNNASLALGAKLIKASNEHYGPALQVISPFKPINMFDGLESSRSRKPDNFEEVVVALARPAAIQKIELDFTYFVNNNPLEVSAEGFSNGQWIQLVAKTNVKAFAGNIKTFKIVNTAIFEQVRVKTYPCGGMNRLKVTSSF